MNKSTILTFALLAFSTLVVAQTTPVDFEDGGNGADWTWSVFENGTNPALEIIDNPDATGGNTSAKVAKITVVPEGETYAGTITSNIAPFKFDASNSIVKIMVWKSVISDVGIKFETANAASNGEIKVANTLVNQWEELTFDFSTQPNFADDFTGLVVFPDFIERADTNVIYFDNITFGSGTDVNEVISIAAAKDSTDGTMVTVKGIATTPSLESGSRTSFFIQQDGVGINIFDFGTPARIVAAGDSIMVTGELDTFNGLREIVVEDVQTDITIINSGNTVPEPRVISYQEFVDAGSPETDTLHIQGSLVKVVGLSTTDTWPEDATASSSNTSATDANDSTYAIRLLADTEAIGVTTPAGMFDLVGIVGTFNGAQLQPRFAADVINYFDVTFQADMTGFIDSAAFIPGSDFVTLPGDFNGFNTEADTLMDADEDGIYATTLNLAPGTYGYKFYLHTNRITGGWENDVDGGNRSISVVDDAVTIAPVEPNIDYPDLNDAIFGTVQLFFQVDMNVQLLNGNFDPTNPDHNVVVAGAMNDWSTTANPLTESQTEGVFETTITLEETAVPSNFAYKFVLNNGQTNWESGDDKIISVTEANQQGEAYVAINHTGTPPFFDGVTFEDIFAEETVVTFKVDLRPAFYFFADSASLPNDVQTGGATTSIDFLAANGPLIAGSWETWGVDLGLDSTIVFNDEGLRGDAVAGDTVYTLEKTFGAGQAKSGAFKLGVNGNDNEGGFGADHNIRIDSDVVELIFGAVVRADSVYDDLYDEYILATESGPVVVRRGGSGDNGVILPNEQDPFALPNGFELSQNYPNPFNPSTNINFTLPATSKVTLSVYNILGQQVAQLVNGTLNAGMHTVKFDASNLSSGMYLYRIEAGTFVQNKRMMLIK